MTANAFGHSQRPAQAAEDLRDLAIVLARTAGDSGRRTSLDDVLNAFGHTREELSALPDEEGAVG